MILYRINDHEMNAETFVSFAAKVWPGNYHVDKTQAALSKTLNIPCKIPHKMKVQLAPCHIPLIKKTSIVLMYVLNLPFLLPPNGIYMYLVKKAG